MSGSKVSTMVVSSSAEQSKFVREFYAVAWSFRWQWMREFIHRGARHPLTVTRNFIAHERRNTLAFDSESKTYRWVPRYSAAGEQELLPSGTPAFRNSSLRGHATQIPFHVGDQAADFIVDFAATQGPFDLVVELGCGYGRVLFEIAYSGLPLETRLVGGELTSSGVEAANAIAALDPDLRLTAHAFDFTQPALPEVPPGRRTLVYTCHAIEQVNRVDQQLVDMICGLGEDVVVVHLEPFAFQVQPDLGPVTEQQRRGFIEKKWNTNLIETLQEAQGRGRIRLDYLAADILFPADPLNPTSLAVWHKTG